MNFLITTATVTAILLSVKLYAYPTLYPDYINRNIKNRTSSSYVADSESRNSFYVLPPSSSFAKVKGLHTVTANVGFCKEISKLQKYNEDTVDLINSIKMKDAATKAQLTEQNIKLQRANEELAKYVAVNNMQELSALDVKITLLEKRLDELYAKYKNCNTDCAILNKDIADSQVLRMDLTTKRFELSASNLAASTEYERKKIYVQGIKSNIEDLQTNWNKIQTDLKALYLDFNRMFDGHAKREGGRVAINYNSEWSENVARLNLENPGYHFIKSQTKNVSIAASAYSKNKLQPDGAVLSFDVGGASADGVLQLGSFPESFSGNAVLSLLAVCPMLHPDWFNLPAGAHIEEMTFGLTANYEYPVAMKFEVTAHYNMYRMYELIKSQGRSGGFFSSSSWSHQAEEEFFSDTFWVDWKVEDEKRVMSYEKKLAINADLRRQMMSRLASYLVMNDQSAKLSLVFDVPDTGAMVLSDSLNKSCPMNVYCRGASIVFGVLQAIFGSAHTEQSLKQITNVEMTDKYSDLQIVMQPMTTTFK